MKRSLHPLSLVAIACALVLTPSCRKEFNSELFNDLPPYQGEWLLPVLRTGLSLQQLTRLESVEFAEDIPPVDIGFPPGVYAEVPPISLPLLGPFSFTTAEYLVELRVQEATLTLTLNNAFPIAMGAGTTVTLRNEANPADPSNIVVQYVLPANVEAGGVISVVQEVNDKSITETLHLYLDNFNSPGGTNVEFTVDAIHIEGTIDVRSIDFIMIKTDRSFATRDSVSMAIGQGLEQDVSSIANGWIHVYSDNGLPVNGSFQMYFYDGSNTLLDSLFTSPMTLVAGATDVNGNTTVEAPTHDSIQVDQTKINSILASRKGVLAFGANTNGLLPPSVIASNSARLRMQIVSDLGLNIIFSEFE